MKNTAILLFLIALSRVPAASAQQPVEKRVGKLENRVGKVEERVSSLEEKRAPGGEDSASLKIQPLSVSLVSKKQLVGAGKVAIKMILEFTNLTRNSINGFSGTLVFKPEGGEIYTRRMSYAHVVAPGDTAQIEMTVTPSQTRQYLKFAKAPSVKVVLINQKLLTQLPQ